MREQFTGVALTFEPGHGRTMNEWIRLPVGGARRWSALAEEALSFALEIAPVIDLVENLGGGDDSEFAQAKRYLEEIATVAAGVEGNGDTSLFRLVVELSE